MCTDFGPSIQLHHHSRILPSLVAAMDDAGNPRVQSHAAAAIINFCDEASPEIMAPYLDQLLRQLMRLLQSSHRLIQEQAVTAVAAVADAAESNFMPYYDNFIPDLKKVLSVASGQKQLRRLRGKVMECISLIGLSVGREKFAADAAYVMDVLVRTQGQQLESDDPQGFYLMQAYARICRCLKEDFIPYLPYVMPGLLASAEQKPDIEVLGPDDEEDVEQDDDMETVHLGDTKIGIRTSVLEDKATACNMIACFVSELKGGFIQYVEPVAQLMVPLLKFFYHEEVRTAAAGCLPDLVRAVKAQGPQMESQTKQLVDFMLPKLIEAARGEPDIEVAVVMLESMADVVDLLSPGMLVPATLSVLVDMVLEMVTDREMRTQERNQEAMENGWDEEEVEQAAAEAEKDDELLSRMSDLVGALLRTHASHGFLTAFETNSARGSLVQLSASLLNPERSGPERHAALCIFDEVIDNGGTAYIEKVLPAMLAYVSDPDPDVRQSASFGVGVCAEKGGQSFPSVVTGNGANIFSILRSVAAAQDSRSDANESATDNVISCLAKIIEFQRPLLGAEASAAVSLWLSYMPIVADAESAVTSLSRLLRLSEAGDELVLGSGLANMQIILRVVADAAQSQVALKEHSKSVVRGFQSRFGDQFSAAISTLSEKQKHEIGCLL
eukprot:CAMPEP_0198324830 /NCGR_PEP_ID=MMETSP1450-20131203/12744_1 /TAXON_ID=753684 ORGANISM="Madagascaria erythrocladiodes, Strain CCMP3234" /NCGR_SAMPLE_ID=MMETSP1450 /ASSEMBLY_ACC=CAM_ASM_001115 /LENGTH=668 /DNA_ID=CAMNT_0044028663 /DNA_START=1 /DNA_END=2007 /DNA_ORIENTATION=-